MYTFVGFSIGGDKEKLKLSGLEINPDKYVDMQRKWRVPNNGKKWQSLAEFAASLIHPSYKEMKQKINKELDHKLWGDSPLPNNLIEYAAKDAYVTYELFVSNGKRRRIIGMTPTTGDIELFVVLCVSVCSYVVEQVCFCNAEQVSFCYVEQVCFCNDEQVCFCYVVM